MSSANSFNKIMDSINETELSVELSYGDIYTIANALVFDGIGDIDEIQKECDSKEEAYNKCYEDYRYWKDTAKEYEYFKKVAEKQVICLAEDIANLVCKEGNKDYLLQKLLDSSRAQAEKEVRKEYDNLGSDNLCMNKN